MDNTLRTMDLNFCGDGKHKISLEGLLGAKNAILLDVRDEKEVSMLKFDFALVGIKTMNIPINQLPDRFRELPKDKLIACFCSSGIRAAWAYIYLLSKGYDVKWLSATNEDLAKTLKPAFVNKNM